MNPPGTFLHRPGLHRAGLSAYSGVGLALGVLTVLTIGLSSHTTIAGNEGRPAALAAETVFHYTDLDRAVTFYRAHLGLTPVETRENAVVLEVAPGALLTLATLESGGYSADTPRTAAIALVTDQLDEWWEALSERDLDMRTETYDPIPGRAHHGFVLADPEGWLLEFERFNAHPENVRLMPQLDVLPTRLVDAASAGLPEGLGFKATVLWLYYDDLATAEEFVVEQLSLPLIVDQGWAKIHPLSSSAYLGLVDGARGMHAFTREKAVFLDVVDPVLAIDEARLAPALKQAKLASGAREVQDPGNHRLRWTVPSGPEAHADYLVLGKSVNSRQYPDGALETLNTVFFAEIFETALGGVTGGVLRGPGDAASGLPFPEGRVHFIAGDRQASLEQLTEHYPDATYTFSFDTPSGRVDGLPVTFDPGVGTGRNPGPIHVSLTQNGRPVDPASIDPGLDLLVEWTPFTQGADDPLGIADDMVYVIFGNCMGEEIVHSGHAISNDRSLTFRDTRFIIPATALRPGEPFQLEVEHSEMDTARRLNIETIVTYAATTFVDIRTTGDADRSRDCPQVPFAMDGGQTDRQRR
ncbi:MAG: VOC family protein [Pseudomonadota bacterium]